MNTYLSQLLSDVETAILARWLKCPPHYFTAGLNEPFLEPPKGFALTLEREEGDDHELSIAGADQTTLMDDESDFVVPSSDDLISNLEIDRSIAEMEQWLEDPPPSKQNMFYHFGFQPEQFPPADRLSDDELDALTIALCRLWAAYNFTAIFPDLTPGRILYPLLLDHMRKPTFVITHGNIGVEFCGYDPKHCPFGEEWCECKEYGKKYSICT